MADAMYRQMLFGNKAYKELFRALEVGETPVLFHCSGGKDRTGVAAMIILLALGASDETIRQDFVRTNECRRPELEKIWAEHADEIAARPEQKKFYQASQGAPRTRWTWCSPSSGKNAAAPSLPRSRIRPDPGPPDAAAADVSGVNFQNCARFP